MSFISNELCEKIMKAASVADDPDKFYLDVVDKLSDMVVYRILAGEDINDFVGSEIKNPLTKLMALSENNEKCITYAGLPKEIQEFLRDDWDQLVERNMLLKLGSEGWRECRDHGPMKNVAYSVKQLPDELKRVSELSQKSSAHDSDRQTFVLKTCVDMLNAIIAERQSNKASE